MGRLLAPLLLVLVVFLAIWAMQPPPKCAPPRVDAFTPPARRNLRVVTVVTDAQEPNLLKLVRSAAFHGVTVDPVVSKVPFGHGHDGFGPKIRLLRKYLDGVPPRDVVMFVDGYDVLIDGSAADILGAFDSLVQGAPKVVCSAEVYCWPDWKLASRYPPTDSPYKFLNSGALIATAAVLRRVMDAHLGPIYHIDSVDDQREWTHVFLNSDDVVLDTQSRIFMTLNGSHQDLEGTGRGWYNTVTKTYPLVFHGNGTAKQFLFDTVMPGLRFQLSQRYQTAT